jgi:hypothetical protein
VLRLNRFYAPYYAQALKDRDAALVVSVVVTVAMCALVWAITARGVGELLRLIRSAGAPSDATVQ